ncbi:hypothetical protein ACVOMV_36445 [Mesorhizobium atlanticum]
MGLFDWLFGGAAKPRIGRPLISDIAVPIPGDDGTPATKNQIDAIERPVREPPLGDLSYQQAAAIMSARSYSKFVMDDVLSKPGVRHPRRPVYLALQANLIAFIVRDPAVRAYVCKWSDKNFESGDAIPPPKNAHWHSGYWRLLHRQFRNCKTSPVLPALHRTAISTLAVQGQNRSYSRETQGKHTLSISDQFAGKHIRLDTGDDTAEVSVTVLPNGPDGTVRYAVTGSRPLGRRQEVWAKYGAVGVHIAIGWQRN